MLYTLVFWRSRFSHRPTAPGITLSRSSANSVLTVSTLPHFSTSRLESRLHTRSQPSFGSPDRLSLAIEKRATLHFCSLIENVILHKITHNSVLVVSFECSRSESFSLKNGKCILASGRNSVPWGQCCFFVSCFPFEVRKLHPRFSIVHSCVKGADLKELKGDCLFEPSPTIFICAWYIYCFSTGSELLISSLP